MSDQIQGNINAAYADYYALMSGEFDPNATEQQDTTNDQTSSYSNSQYTENSNYLGEYYDESNAKSSESTKYPEIYSSGQDNQSQKSGSGHQATHYPHQSPQNAHHKYQAPQPAHPDPNEGNLSIYISGLPPETTIEDLKQFFGSIGVIKTDKRTKEAKITIYRDHETNEPKGDASVMYDDAEAAKAAIKWFNEKEFMGKKIHVEYAHRRMPIQKPQKEVKETAQTEGDWQCPSCGNINWPRRLACNRCKVPRPVGATVVSVEQQPMRVKKPPRTQSTDWSCDSCGNVNWGWRQTCNRCNKTRTTQTEEDETQEEEFEDKREGNERERERNRDDRRSKDYSHREDKREREREREEKKSREDRRERERERDKEERRERERDRDDRRKDSHKDSARDKIAEDRRERRDRPY